MMTIRRMQLWAICVLLAGVALGDELPSESSLPESQATPPASPGPLADELPSEGALPAGAGDEAGPPAGPLPLEGSPDGVPWLRLNLDGHTAPARAAVFTPSGERLCTAGDDKSVVVWRRTDSADNPWRYERTIRWQVQRGTAGRVYALAAADGLLAIAGEGAMGGNGEIVLVDPASGDFVASLVDYENGHRQVIVSLDFAETDDGPVLASHSMDGRTLLWRRDARGVWQASVAQQDDRAAGRPAGLRSRLLAARAFSAAVAIDAHTLVAPTYEREQAGAVLWRLRRFDTRANSNAPLDGRDGVELAGGVFAIATDSDRKRLVASDYGGSVYLFDLTKSPATATRLNRTTRNRPISLALSPDGGTLAIGTTGAASLEWWDLKNPRQPRRLGVTEASESVLGCAVSPDANEIAFTQGDAVHIAGGDRSVSQRLRANVEVATRVAFSREEPYYRIGISLDGDEITREFDTDRLRLLRTQQQPARDWLPKMWGQGDWSVGSGRNEQGLIEWWLEERGARRASLPINAATTGAFRSVCWVPGADMKRPPLAALGLSSGEIYVVSVADQGDAPVVRRFRGHTAEVTSMAVSRDLRWLVSSSKDATIRVWPLGPAAEASSTLNRWGAEFEIGDSGQLLVESLREDGPLYAKGVREGDEIASCYWLDSGEKVTIEDSAELQKALTETPWNRLVTFAVRTGRQPTREFQRLPAWQQVVSLTLDQQGEWAYWAPSGHYDASFEGHRLFGWQINRGLEKLPDFFLAERFRAVLERPEVMSRLLRSGSVDAAFRAAARQPPADPAQAIANAYRMKPQIELLSPAAGADLSQQPPILRARITVPPGQSLVAPKAFASGVVAPAPELVGSEQSPDGEVLEYEWRLAVPSDSELLVQVFAATETEVTTTAERLFKNTKPEPKRRPRLHLLAVGVDDYRDAQIPDLRTPAERTESLTSLLKTKSASLYQVDATSLLNTSATRPAWRVLTEQSAEQLRDETSPDDLLVIYLSGHGLQDPEGDQFHFVTADASYSDMMAGRFGECLSLAELSRFADCSCRKLVVLDACHAGAIQPLRRRELKLAVRALQDDLLLTLAASDGGQEAVEGRFSKRLLEALAGAADSDGGNQDGIVQLDELVAYLERTVAQDSLNDAVVQTPTAGPRNLLRYARPALTKADPEKQARIDDSGPESRVLAGAQ